MKKLIYIFISALVFTSCGGDDNYPNPNPDPTPSDWNGDWNNKNDKNYKPEGYNPIKGEWEAYSLNGKNYTGSYFVKFSSDLIMYKSEGKPAEGKDPIFDDAEDYIINDKGFRLKQDNYCKYNLKNNALTIFISPNTWILKPYIHKEWRWDGDWNDPKDPHYAQYQGKYNPIKGVWQITHIDGDETSSKSIITFTEDFKWIDEIQNSETYYLNSTGLRRLKDSIAYKYTIENNTLSIQRMYPKEGIILRYKRIKM